MHGLEWIIDARGCDPDRLCDVNTLDELFARIVAELALTPVGAAAWHRFPAPGGVTGLLMLAESHLACHSFPEFGAICLNLFCCRPRRQWDAQPLIADLLGATSVSVRQIERDYSPVASPQATATTR